MDGKLSKGTSVVSLEGGATLGKVDHVYLDPERKELVALSFQSGGGLLHAKSSHLVEIDDIHAIGPDAVTLPDPSVVRDPLAVDRHCSDLVDLEQLIKRTVMTDRGRAVGYVTGFSFDERTSRLAWLDVSHGPLHGKERVPGHAVTHIGDDVIVIADTTEH